MGNVEINLINLKVLAKDDRKYIKIVICITGK